MVYFVVVVVWVVMRDVLVFVCELGCMLSVEVNLVVVLVVVGDFDDDEFNLFVLDW